MVELSIIMPCYRGEKFIENSIHSVEKVVSEICEDFEVIVVVDGFADRSYEVAKRLENVYENLKVLGYEKNQGKGFAIRYGFENSSGDVIVFIDSDLDIDPYYIKVLLDIFKKDKCDIVVASKRHRYSEVNYPLIRKFLSESYYILTYLLFRLNVRDTQTGLKLFKREVLEKVFKKALIKKYAFDVELLVLAKKYGYKIKEAPVKINLKKNSFSLSGIYHMLVDTLAIAYRLYIRRYYD